MEATTQQQFFSVHLVRTHLFYVLLYNFRSTFGICKKSLNTSQVFNLFSRAVKLKCYDWALKVAHNDYLIFFDERKEKRERGSFCCAKKKQDLLKAKLN